MDLKSKRKERNGRQETKRVKKMQIQRKEIPESVVMEILSRLPVKSLARFRCVCKPWASSFGTSYFITKHYRNSVVNNNNKLMFFERPGRRGYFCDFTFVYGPCNGLLCIFVVTKEKHSLNLWNPSTREYKLIPESRVPRPPWAGQCRGLVFGFGYDSLTDDYKVVRILMFDPITHVELYSLKAHSWKQIPPPHPRFRPRPLRILLVNNYVNGCYYWQLTSPHRDLILSFDMSTEKFSTLPSPINSISRDHDHVRGMELLDFNGLLGAVAYWPQEYLDLWVMMNGSWTKRFSFDPFPQLWMPLGFSKIGEIFFMSSDSELALLDPSTKEVKNLGLTLDRYRCSLKLILYDESLVSINGTSDEELLLRRPVANIQIDSEVNNDTKPKIYML